MSTDTLISHGQARRLALDLTAHHGEAVLAAFVATGEIEAPGLLELLARVQAAAPDGRDPRGVDADVRALAAYVAAAGPRGPVTGWTAELDLSVVPWAYGR